jgi:H+/Cl- antiporter ClcA
MGHDFALLFNHSEARQFLVIVGMAAFLAGVLQAPVTTAVLLVEMTGNQSAFLYILLVSFAGAYSSRIVFSPSLYEVLINKIMNTEPKKT